MKIKYHLIVGFGLVILLTAYIGWISIYYSEIVIKSLEIKSHVPYLLFVSEIIILIFGLLIGFLISRRISKPLDKLIKGTELFGKGNLKHRIDIRSDDELGELAESFNNMANELEINLNEVMTDRAKLKNYQKYLEKKVLERTAELEKSKGKLKKDLEKLKDLDKLKVEFLSLISHELKTPLTPIKVQIERLLRKKMTKKETNESLEMVLRSVNRLARLINDILDISRIDSARMRFSMQDVDVKPFIDHTVKTMAPLADNSKVKIKTTFKGLPLKLQFDPDRIQQVLINLISNAIDHSETKKLSIGSIKKGDNIVFYVKDYGAGISTKELPHIFDKFYSGKERKMFHHGTGLGLAICNGIMDAHKGKIWVESNLKKGTTFFFSLPLNKKNYKDKK